MPVENSGGIVPNDQETEESPEVSRARKFNEVIASAPFSKDSLYFAFLAKKEGKQAETYQSAVSEFYDSDQKFFLMDCDLFVRDFSNNQPILLLTWLRCPELRDDIRPLLENKQQYGKGEYRHSVTDMDEIARKFMDSARILDNLLGDNPQEVEHLQTNNRQNYIDWLITNKLADKSEVDKIPIKEGYSNEDIFYKLLELARKIYPGLLSDPEVSVEGSPFSVHNNDAITVNTKKGDKKLKVNFNTQFGGQGTINIINPKITDYDYSELSLGINGEVKGDARNIAIEKMEMEWHEKLAEYVDI
jgi:hypothetical protein